jgi:hypothetical protein
VVGDGRGRPRPRRGETKAGVLTAFLIAEVLTVVGAAIGFRLHGYELVSLLWVVPGIAALLWAFARFERWRGREVPLFVDRLVVAMLFIPGIALGDWLQDVAR